MEINHIQEGPDGVVFQGTLEGAELALVIEVGLNYLMQQGALPFLSKESTTIDPELVHNIPEQIQ